MPVAIAIAQVTLPRAPQLHFYIRECRLRLKNSRELRGPKPKASGFALCSVGVRKCFLCDLSPSPGSQGGILCWSTRT
jgi:hypothetical protein